MSGWRNTGMQHEVRGVITREPSDILNALSAGRLPLDSPAVPKGVFMVEPVNFRLSEDSARDNQYMDMAAEVDADRALEQYLELVQLIRHAGVTVKSFTGHSVTPEDVFPNNVFGTAPAYFRRPGRLIIGRMLHESRRKEAERQDVRNYFSAMGYEIVDLSGEDCVAELTGPLVIDRGRRLGFCGMSSRVDETGLTAMNQAFDLRHTLQFELAPGEYHTNVILSVLASRACVVQTEAIVDPRVKRALAVIYDEKVLHLDRSEKQAFAGNCIALTPNDVFMSQTAADGLRPQNRALLEYWGFRIHSVALDEIEKAGGSLRCMVAEIY